MLGHGDGSVVVLHGWPDRMLGAVEGALARLPDAGATFVRIDELDGVPSVGASLDELAGAT